MRDRVAPFELSQFDVKPRITYHIISSNRLRELSGGHTARRVRVQVDVYGNTYKECDAILDLLEAIDNQFGTWGGVKVDRVFIVNDSEQEGIDVAEVTHTTSKSIDLMFWVQE